MAPVVHGLENKYKDVMNFVFLDIDDPQTKEIREQMNFNLSWRPFIFFIDSEGEVVGDVFIGPQSAELLEQAVIDLLVLEGVYQQ